MQKKRSASILTLVLGLLAVAPAPKLSAQGTSTPEERARWAEITHKLESNPLDESVNKDGEWALNRLSDAHDIHVPWCLALLGEFNDARYKYRYEITRLTRHPRHCVQLVGGKICALQNRPFRR